MQHHIPEERKKFQIERMVFFSDAVIAIAITLLVLEIKIPVFDPHISSREISAQLTELIPKFFGYLLSFVMIGIYWAVHHRTFAYATNYDNHMLWLNLFFLMFVVLMPFSSGLYSENFQFDICFIIYGVNMIAMGIFAMLLFQSISRDGMSIGLENHRLRQYYYSRSLVPVMAFMTGIILCLFHQTTLSYLARYSPMLIWPGMVIVRRRFGDLKKKDA